MSVPEGSRHLSPDAAPEPQQERPEAAHHHEPGQAAGEAAGQLPADHRDRAADEAEDDHPRDRDHREGADQGAEDGREGIGRTLPRIVVEGMPLRPRYWADAQIMRFLPLLYSRNDS